MGETSEAIKCPFIVKTCTPFEKPVCDPCCNCHGDPLCVGQPDGTVCGTGDVCTGGACVPPCELAGVAYTIGQTPPGSSCTVCTPQGWQPQPCSSTTTLADGGVATFVIPPIPGNVTTSASGAGSFLFTGVDGGPPIQTGADASAISPALMGVIHGTVSDPSGSPLAGAVVAVLAHPEFGQTTTLSDGTFNLAVNGGGLLTIAISAAGYLPVQRTIAKVPWNGYALAGAVVMTKVDPGTSVHLSSNSPQIVRGATKSDSSGSRTATLYVPSSTSAAIAPGNGAGASDAGTSGTPVATLTVHATEFTVGPNGRAAMPGDLPTNSAYTYAVEYSADEVPPGSHVAFSQPVIAYTDNFLQMNVGERVPAGYYDRDRGQWVPSTDGLVIKILTVNPTTVDLGTGMAANSGELRNVLGASITPEELTQLGKTYAAGTTLWRVAIPHFTPWDFNWPFMPPNGSTAPPVPNPVPPGGGPGGGGGGGSPPPPSCSETCCTSVPPGGGASYNNGSYIECYTGIVHESIPIPGTPYRLTYSNDRVAGYSVASSLEIPLTGSAPVPSAVTGIEMEVDIAGRSLTQSFPLPASANQVATFVWDGMDAFGRFLQGGQVATVSVGYTYPGVYLSAKPNVATYDATFGHYSYFGVPATGDGTRQTVTLWSRAQAPVGPIGHWSAEGLGLGGWTLDVEHVYDPSARTLYLGDGTQQAGNEPLDGRVISTVVGNGKAGYSVDGTLATNAQLNAPSGTAVLPDGSLLIDDAGNCVIRKVMGGVISTVAGIAHNCGYNGLNQPATRTMLWTPGRIAVAPDGSFYFTDAQAGLIRHVGLDGMITIAAGVPVNPSNYDTNCNITPYSGDGLPATGPGANLFPTDVIVAKDGSLYFADYHQATSGSTGGIVAAIRKVDPAGLLSTITDGLSSLAGIAQSPDGDIYGAVGLAVVKIDVGGAGVARHITNFASASPAPPYGAPSVVLPLAGPGSLAVGSDGTIYISDSSERIYAASPGGTAVLIAGNGMAGYSGDKGPAVNAQIDGYGALALSGDDQTLYSAEGVYAHALRAISPSQPGFTNASFAVAAASGAEVYEFGFQGQHIGTLSLPTNAPRVRLGYTNGLVTSVTDADGNVTTIQRSGNQVTIVSPFGVPTTLNMGSDGYLAHVVDPTGAQYSMGYDPGGLLAMIAYPTSSNGQYVSSKSYDSLGRVVRTSDAAGHALTLNRQPDGLSSVALTKTTSAGVTTSLAAQIDGGVTTWTATNPDNTTAQLQRGADGTLTSIAADGTLSVSTFGPDPRFGMQTPITTNRTIRVPGAAPDGGAVTEAIASTRTVVLGNPVDPLSLVSQTDTVQINSFQPTVRTYYADGGVLVTTSPMGRTTVMTLNQLGQRGAGQPAELQVPEIAPTFFQYNDAGQPIVTQQGTFPLDGGAPRQWSQTYDSHGYVQSETDPADASTTYTNDLAGRPMDTYLPAAPDGGVRDLNVVYDGDGNPKNVTLPAGNLHQFSYTPVDALASYTPPPPTGDAGTWSTQDSYDGDGRPALETRPDGSQIQRTYDPTTGKLSKITYTQPNVTGTQVYGYSYYPTTGQLQTLSAPSGETLTYAWGGSLSTGITWSGPVSGQVTFGYDNALRPIAQGLNGNALAFGYDQDNLMTSAGAETIQRDPQNGRLNGTTLGALSDSYTYDPNGQLASYVAQYNTTVLYSETINARYADGRIQQRTETLASPTTGQTDTYLWNYGYDAAGRLRMANLTATGPATGVTNYERQYGYDADDNRTSFQDTSTGVTSVLTYDAQDRLTSYGGTTYQYGPNGELQSIASPGGFLATYGYDVFGNLLSATLSNSPSITYVVDGQNRRVGKSVNGTLTTSFLYQDQLKIVAQTSGSGAVVSRFVYGSKSNVPDYYTDASGSTYRIFSDHLGSPRLLVNVATGSVLEEVLHDEFGNVLLDVATVGVPGAAMPFGFAGALRDPYTGLLRFGARDYDPSVGRWTSKDPIRFEGGNNYYVYVNNDPVNNVDPAGLYVPAPIVLAPPLAPPWLVPWLGPLGAGLGAFLWGESGSNTSAACEEHGQCGPPTPPTCSPDSEQSGTWETCELSKNTGKYCVYKCPSGISVIEPSNGTCLDIFTRRIDGPSAP